jgi:RNA polymerase sigma factor (sigma-70 family)
VQTPRLTPQSVPHFSFALNESDFFQKWLPEIDRAARFRVWVGHWKFSDIEDLKQEIALRLLRVWRQLAYQPDVYVRKAIRNTTLNLIRDQRRDPLSAVPLGHGIISDEEAQPPEEATTADFLEQLVENRKVAEWALKLPQGLRQVFRHLYQLDYSQREAAIAIGLSQQRIAQYHSKLIKLAREEFFSGFT